MPNKNGNEIQCIAKSVNVYIRNVKLIPLLLIDIFVNRGNFSGQKHPEFYNAAHAY